jgi:hypothetical protein
MRTTLTFSPVAVASSGFAAAVGKAAAVRGLSTFPTGGPGSLRGAPERAVSEKSLMEGPGRTVLFVVYSSVARGNIPMRNPFGGSAKIAVIPGGSFGIPSLVSRRAVPAPVRRLALFCARFR